MGSRRPPAGDNASSDSSASRDSPSSSSDDESSKRKRKLAKAAAKAAAATTKRRRSADSASPAPVPGAAAGKRPAAGAAGSAADANETRGGAAGSASAAGAGQAAAPAAPTAAADPLAAKRAKADALMAKLTAKLEATSNPAKRLALQDKMLKLLPKCTPQPTPPAKPKAAAGPTVSHGLGAGFQFKLARTPKAAFAPPPAALQGPEELARRRQRQQRFAGSGAAEEDDEADAVLTAAGGVGTSAALEKEYLRLTSLPRAADVRPPHVLAAALKLVKSKWLSAPDYHSASEQLKAIRQDLTVQHVRDGLAVDAYETAGRLALEADDLAEFRRCHAVLRQLYAELGGANAAEFEAYGLLYTQANAAARNTLSLELSRVPPHLLGHPFVRHAMEVCAAARSGNYARFVSLYDGAPRMSPYIMDRLLGRMRLLALNSSVAAFRPMPLPLSYLAEQMGLEGEEEAAELAEQHGAVVDRAAGVLDTRTSSTRPLGPPRPPGEGAAG
ncbi:hypothetical protein HXX76_001043 [Chlamydomonas incerta]|uniref:SAC3/GANP/THP3 conserved domain-containing protein n=1 Tax=Chlamydomonas incerta TaxID=51695 RepID=A0A835WBG1_CHLIN|nr:hypothetical protein HXX76_001043 [Chlamydomonas incerta]|eukprot:KAG2444286.1 hypothetical protein HXX76_001043 [Chlamydomonas incerta]